MGGLYSRAFIVAVALNFAWEMAQAPLYIPMGTAWEATWRCFAASLGDGVVVLLIAAGGAVVWKSAAWVVNGAAHRFAMAAVAGLVVAFAIERWGLATGRWQYNALMPLVPGANVGLAPLVQMALLAPVSLRLAGLWSRSTSR